jgi:GntR family transcriptional regulator, transcriptional repressor for pyruvate dehydrogenase complex
VVKPVAPTTEPQFTAIRRKAVAHSAIATIKGMIVRGELRAGQRLPAERDLAARLGLSRPSLREAIRALIALNILESRHGEGTFVSSLDPELLTEPIDFVLQVDDDALVSLFEARRVLEAGVATLAAERATDLELAELDRFAKEGRRNVKDAEAFAEHEAEFHERVRRLARSPVLASLLSSLSTLSSAGPRRAAEDEAVRARALADHQATAKALRARDAATAESVMEAHLQKVLEALKRLQ